MTWPYGCELTSPFLLVDKAKTNTAICTTHSSTGFPLIHTNVYAYWLSVWDSLMYLQWITSVQYLSINHRQFLIIYPPIIHLWHDSFVIWGGYCAWCPKPPRGNECLFYTWRNQRAQMDKGWWRWDTREIVQGSSPLHTSGVFLCRSCCCSRVAADECDGSRGLDQLQIKKTHNGSF